MNTKINLTNKVSESVEEAFRTLRTNIQFCSTEKTIKTICITSCIPNEGKTTTVINLAISLVSANKRVLVIDADMRKPRQYKDLTSKYNLGLSNYLSGMAEYGETFTETNYDGLKMILCGPKPPNPAELLGTSRFSEMLEKVSNVFDYVLIDTPPLGSMIDAAIIASKTDGTILVIESNAIDHKKEVKVKEQLEKANARIIGVVLNKIQRKDYKDYYYYYDYNYRKGNKDNRKSKQDQMIGTDING